MTLSTISHFQSIILSFDARQKLTESARLPFKDGLRDWDCAEALSLDDMLASLQHIRKEGTFPVRHVFLTVALVPVTVSLRFSTFTRLLIDT